MSVTLVTWLLGWGMRLAAALLVLVVSAALVGTRDEPAAAALALERVLSAGECAISCFAGIEPGTTTGSEAALLLERHVWIGEVDLRIDFSTLAWEWSGAQPDWVDASQPGVLLFSGESVQYIRIATRVRLGEAWALLGAPLADRIERGSPLQHSAIYAGGTVHLVQPALRCRFTVREYWRERVWLLLTVAHTDGWIEGDGWAYDPYARPYC